MTGVHGGLEVVDIIIIELDRDFLPGIKLGPAFATINTIDFTLNYLWLSLNVMDRTTEKHIDCYLDASYRGGKISKSHIRQSREIH